MLTIDLDAAYGAVLDEDPTLPLKDADNPALEVSQWVALAYAAGAVQMPKGIEMWVLTDQDPYDPALIIGLRRASGTTMITSGFTLVNDLTTEVWTRNSPGLIKSVLLAVIEAANELLDDAGMAYLGLGS